MNGNHNRYQQQQQHLLSTSGFQSSILTSQGKAVNSKQEQQASVMASSNFNGLPTSAANNVRIEHSQDLASNYSIPSFERRQRQQPNKLQDPKQQESNNLEASITQSSAAFNGTARYLQVGSSNKPLLDHQRHQYLAEQQHRQLVAQMAANHNFYSPTSDSSTQLYELTSQQSQRSSNSTNHQQQSHNINNNNNNNNHPQIIQQQNSTSKTRENNSHYQFGKNTNYLDESALLNDAHLYQKEHYASQLRSSNLQHRFHLPVQQQEQTNHYLHSNSSTNQVYNQNHMQQRQKQSVHQTVDKSQQSAQSPSATTSCVTSSSRQKPAKSSGVSPASQPVETRQQVHVNFNRPNGNGQDADEGDSRKKKYLTAKYGQQQMNLIKKRLKIEMWLYEQLQELAKASKSEADLDEIDIDLDQLLDIDDEDKRRHWLEKLLEPFGDLQPDRLRGFIDDVLEQSKLL